MDGGFLSNPFILGYYCLYLQLKIIGVKKCHENKENICKVQAFK
jgi:hypothetical protein